MAGKRRGESQAQKRKRFTKGVLLSIGGFLGLLLLSLYLYNQALREERAYAEAQFDRYDQNMRDLIADLDTALPADSPARIVLQTASNARIAANIQEGTDLRAAQRLLEDGYGYLCEVTPEVLGQPCSVPDGRAAGLTENPNVMAAGAVLSGAGLTVATAYGTFRTGIDGLLERFGRRGKPEGGA